MPDLKIDAGVHRPPLPMASAQQPSRCFAMTDTPVRLRLRFAPATPDTLRPDDLSLAAPRGARQGEAWWGKKDSNLRSHKTADLQSAPFATRDTPPFNNIGTRPLDWRRRGHG